MKHDEGSITLKRITASEKCVCGRHKKPRAYACYRCRKTLGLGLRELLFDPPCTAAGDAAARAMIKTLKDGGIIRD